MSCIRNRTWYKNIYLDLSLLQAAALENASKEKVGFSEDIESGILVLQFLTEIITEI